MNLFTLLWVDILVEIVQVLLKLIFVFLKNLFLNAHRLLIWRHKELYVIEFFLFFKAIYELIIYVNTDLVIIRRAACPNKCWWLRFKTSFDIISNSWDRRMQISYCRLFVRVWVLIGINESSHRPYNIWPFAIWRTSCGILCLVLVSHPLEIIEGLIWLFVLNFAILPRFDRLSDRHIDLPRRWVMVHQRVGRTIIFLPLYWDIWLITVRDWQWQIFLLGQLIIIVNLLSALSLPSHAFSLGVELDHLLLCDFSLFQLVGLSALNHSLVFLVIRIHKFTEFPNVFMTLLVLNFFSFQNLNRNKFFALRFWGAREHFLKLLAKCLRANMRASIYNQVLKFGHHSLLPPFETRWAFIIDAIKVIIDHIEFLHPELKTFGADFPISEIKGTDLPVFIAAEKCLWVFVTHGHHGNSFFTSPWNCKIRKFF